MRSMLIITAASLAFAICAEDVPILRKLQWMPEHKKVEQTVFQSRDEMLKVWLADGGKEADLPSLDWDKEIAVAAFGGAEVELVEAWLNTVDEPLGAPERENRRPDDPVRVTYRQQEKDRTIAVIKRLVGKFKFVDADSAQGKREAECRKSRKAAEDNLANIARAMMETESAPKKLLTPEQEKAQLQIEEVLKKRHEEQGKKRAE